MKPTDPEAHATLSHVDPEFGRIALQIGAWTWAREGLTPHLCSLLCTAADLCCGTLELSLQMHIQIAVRNEVTPLQMHEAMLTVAPWAGYPQTMGAVVRLRDILSKFGLGNLPYTNQQNPLDAAVEVELQAFTPSDRESGDFLVQQMRHIWARDGLSNAERAILTAAGHVCLDTLGETFALSVRLARAAGVPEAQLLSALRFVGEYGWARSLRALEIVKGLQ